jgi:23S rRNA pseudouridine1911/1915/1917 synthase
MPPRNFVVSRKESGRTIAAVVRARLGLSVRAVRGMVRAGRVWLNGAVCRDAGRRVAPGERLEVRTPTPREPRPGAAPAGPVVRYADAQVVVVDKPAGLTTVRHADEAAEFGARAQRYLPPTLADLLPELLGGGRQWIRAVHRLDKETSGLVVFARTPEAERHLGRQFRAHTIERRYLTLVRGRAAGGTIESHLVRDRGDGRRGSSAEPGAGQRGVTHVRVVKELGEYTLVECRLETGRTHQVRIHLGEAGTPLCGDHVYDRPLNGRPLPDASGVARVALHASRLGFEHPQTGKHMVWTAPLPRDMADLVERFRRQARR